MSAEQRLLQQARLLFKRQGFSRTTVAQICQYAQVSRVTYYKYFSDKEDIIIAILDEHIGKSRHLLTSFNTSSAPLRAKVKQLVEIKIAQSQQFSEQLFEELFQKPTPKVSEYIAQQGAWQRNALVDLFDTARKTQSIHPDVSNELIFYLLAQMELWFKDPAFHQVLPSFEQKIHHALNFFFFGIQGNLDDT